MLENFEKRWKACNGDPEAEHRLVKLIVDRVYMQDEVVVAMTLRADYPIILGHNANEPIKFWLTHYTPADLSNSVTSCNPNLDRCLVALSFISFLYEAFAS
jgi:hypothetical protein